MDGWMGRNMGGRVKKMKEQKKVFQKHRYSIDIVSYALNVSVNGVTCVFVVHFRS